MFILSIFYNNNSQYFFVQNMDREMSYVLGIKSLALAIPTEKLDHNLVRSGPIMQEVKTIEFQQTHRQKKELCALKNAQVKCKFLPPNKM